MSGLLLLTGASGYIGKHLTLRFLQAGWSVRASVRGPEREGEVRDAVGPHLRDPGALDRLTFVHLELNRDTGWDEAARGVDALVHSASPFPIAQPDRADDVIRPAVDGTLRALRSARDAGVRRVLLTSSIAAVYRSVLPDGREVHDESDWSDPAHPAATFYDQSKTLAERAAWNFVHEEAPEIALTSLNPAFVLGAPLDGRYGSSVGLVARILSGKDMAWPRFGFPLVDVRDVAEMHLRALERSESAGRRYLGAAGSMWLSEMARTLREAHPGRRIPARTAPDLMVRLLALFDAEVRSILPDLGTLHRVSARRAEEELGIRFTPPEASLLATARHLLERGTE